MTLIDERSQRSVMNLLRFFDLNRLCFLGLFLLKAFTRRVAEFDGKNYPKATLLNSINLDLY